MLMRAFVPAALLMLCAGDAVGFQLLPTAPHSGVQGLRTAAKLSGTRAQVRPRAVGGLRMLDEAAVAKNMEAISAGKAPAKPPTKVFKALKKSSGAIAAGCEYKREADNTALLSVEDAVDLRQLGMKIRRLKASVLCVDCSTPAGKGDCEEAVKEQLSAKGGFPGPMPVVRTGPVTSVNDIAEAKAMGAEGVVLSMSEEGAQDMIKACALLAIEPIVQVTSQEEIDAVVAAGGKCIVCDLSLRDGVPKDVAAVALLDSRVEDPQVIFSVAASEKDEMPTPKVIEQLAKLKEGKFNAVIAMDVMRKPNRIDTAYTTWLVEQVQSKQSGKFAALLKTPSLGQGNPLARPDGILYEVQ